ncbi:MAG: uncharacterized protein QOJ16_3868 [Acidobacteriota bacterium]|jgi:uncharacterized protein|nr:uncharacterized protein [Acidobacteriota bacterium]
MSNLGEQFRGLESVQFSSEEAHVLFIPETLQLFLLSPAGAAALDGIRQGKPLAEAASEGGYDPGALEGFVHHLIAEVGKAPSAARARAGATAEEYIGPVLPKLVFMVNNFCNLRCTYCYEHATVFKEPATTMTRELVDSALERFHAAFRGCAELMFIGGEPTLSESIIEYACLRAAEISRERGVEISFSMITNGVRMTEKMFEIIDRFGVQVTFSMDGPQKVHDSERLRQDGSGSYDLMMKNVRRYQEKHADKLGVECTLTHAQARRGVTVSDLSRFFADELDVSAPHIAAAGLVAGDLLNPFTNQPTRLENEFEQAAGTAMDELFLHLEAPDAQIGKRAGLDLVSGMVKRLMRRQSALEMCPAGTSQLVVDSHGDVYPCWMFAGMPAFRMGNVTRDPVFNDVARKVLQRIIENDKRRNPQCSVCYARYACNACLGNNQNSTGLLERIDENYCNTIRGTLRTVVLKLGEAKADKARWEAIRGGAGRSADLRKEHCPC